MKVLRFLFGLLITTAAALAGNWIGGQIRFKIRGETTASLHYVHTTASGMQMDNFPVNTKFIPALLFSLFGRPRWLFAFLGGILASLWIDNKYEAIYLERFIVPLVKNIEGNSTSRRN